MRIFPVFRFSTPLFVLMLATVPVRGQEWQDAPAMPVPRYDMAASVLDGQIYVIGGLDGAGNAVASVLRFDPSNGGAWHDAAPLDGERFDAAAVTLDGRIYVIGGVDDDGDVLDEVEAYLPHEDRWIEIDDLEEGRRGHRAVVIDGRIYVVGGVDEKGKVVKEVEVYDPAENKWSVSEKWKPKHARVAFALVALDGAVYALGGFGGETPVPITEPEVFEGGSVSVIPPGLLRQRGRLAAATVASTAYLLGGVGDHGRPVRDMIRFEPSAQKPSDRWLQGPAMQSTRERFAAVAVDGRLYAIGGRDERSALPSVETMLVSTGLEPPSDVAPIDVTLEQNHPNPFTHSTTVSLVVDTDRPERLTVEVYDPLGRRVRTLVEGVVLPGRHEIVWDGRGEDGRLAGSGTYFCVLQRDGRRSTTSMILIR